MSAQPLDYASWIDRERRVRIKILITSPATAGNVFRVCSKCGEVCLCHEEACPNCGSPDIEKLHLDPALLPERIRCLKRFDGMKAEA